MKKEILFMLLSAAVIIISCTAKNYFIESGYEDQKISGGLLLIPKINNLNIYQEESVFNEAELDSIKNRFLSGFGTELNKEILQVSNFKNVGNMEYKQLPEFRKQSFFINEKEMLEISVPRDRIAIQSKDNVFILFIENGIINLLKDERDTSDPAKHYSVSTTPAGGVDLHNLKFYDNQFSFSANYLIYDNTNAKVVKCGTVNTKYKHTQNTDLDDLVLKITTGTAEKILKDSPFYN